MARAPDATLPALTGARHHGGSHPGIRQVIGEAAWRDLPPAVRSRFAEGALGVDYVGEFEVVRASRLGRVLAQFGRLIGTPVVPWVGGRLAAIVHVAPEDGGIAWNREYLRADGARCMVRSIKVVTPALELVERLPAGLCMSLRVYASDGVLHFVSRGYYFRVPLPGGRELRIPLPAWCDPGETHVEHVDEGAGWFRFTMTVTHTRFGELFYQTGRFRAATEVP